MTDPFCIRNLYVADLQQLTAFGTQYALQSTAQMANHTW